METGLQQPEVSFHFWNCQLSEASPKYSWDPENWGSAASGRDAAGERRQRRPDRHGNGDGEGNENGDTSGDGKANGEATAAENGHRNGDSDGEKRVAKGNCKESVEEAGEENGEAATDADYMQHVLKVNACILGPKATGVHLISVRTRCYQSEPDSCPIVCIDPASNRTLAVAYEFVLDSQNEVTFELTEGTGPVWLTGLHQVRVHEDAGDGEVDGEDVEAECEGADEAMASDESMKEAGDEEDGDEEEVEEEEEEDEEDDEDEEEEEEEEIRPPPKRVARASKSERPVASPKQARRRAPEKPAAAVAAKVGKGKSASPSPPKKKAPAAMSKESAAAAKGVGNKRGAAAKSKA